MRKLRIPFIYRYNNTYIYKRVYKLEGEIITTVKIYYKLDFFTYKVIEKEFYNADNTLTQIDNMTEVIIIELDKIFRVN